MVRGQLEEPADRRAALVELAGRVEEARAVAGGRRAPGPVAQQRPDPGEGLVAGRRRGDERLEAEVGVGPAAGEVAGQLPDDVAAGRGEPERRIAVEGEAVAAGDRLARRRVRRRRRGRDRAPSTSRVSCLASSTLGWSNGSMPRTAPAIAVATSQRTNSAPRSIGSASSIRMTGWPAASSASARASRPPSVRARQRDPDERPVRAVRLDRAERLEVDRDDPDAVLAGALGDELLDPRPEARDLVVGQERQLVAAGLGEGPDREPEREPGVGRRVRLAAGGQHRRRRRQQRVEVDPDERRRHEADVGQRASSGRRCRAG